MELNHYYTNQELENLCSKWVNKYPNLVTKSHIGESFEHRPIWLLTLTNNQSGPDAEKPAVWIDANIHATEIAGTTVALQIAQALLQEYGVNPNITRIMDNCVYYIVPRVNPDGAELAMADIPRYIRSGVRPYPWPEQDAGLHEKDIDRDGRILLMRFRDPNGDWKISELDPRLMVRRSPIDNSGEYYRLWPEGILREFDGYVVKYAQPVEGLDFNRNFPFEWRTEDAQSGAGPYPVSEPETRAIVDFVCNHPNINLAITYHTFSRVILRPFSTKSDDEMETEDLWVSKKIGEIGSKLTGYRCANTFQEFKYSPKEITTGGFDDWIFDHLGIFAYTIELWDMPTEAGINDRKFIEWFRDHPQEEDLQILQWADQHAGPGAFVDWYPFEHPQLGKIELGGWNTMYTWRNPPEKFLGAEAARNTPFALALGDMLPHLDIHTLEVTPLASGDFHVNLVVDNTGFLPTFTSEQGKKRKAVRPVRAEIELPDGVSIISGKREVELGHLAGRSNKLAVHEFFSASPTDNRSRTEWVLHADRDAIVKINISSERAGSLHRSIQLKSVQE